MISAARDHELADHPSCNLEFESACCLRVLAHAFMYAIAFWAYF